MDRQLEPKSLGSMQLQLPAKCDKRLPLFQKLSDFRYRFDSIDDFKELAQDVEQYKMLVERREMEWPAENSGLEREVAMLQAENKALRGENATVEPMRRRMTDLRNMCWELTQLRRRKKAALWPLAEKRAMCQRMEELEELIYGYDVMRLL
ncbi:hypothetical protein Dda_1537 [Drechslerella dactyloides]|uniref:Uncharacterized protein n=1 Tax=Drechslerella dactyloides TaxID=74499 RepID=A0AAD6J1W4_DREDA|nr:hypothetical protein Dda_1537 [Drechslerella dactyloides]